MVGNAEFIKLLPLAWGNVHSLLPRLRWMTGARGALVETRDRFFHLSREDSFDHKDASAAAIGEVRRCMGRRSGLV